MSMKTGYTVEQIMTRNVLTVVPEMKVMDVAKLMADKEVGSVVVCKKNEVVGILTEQDLARKVLAKGINPETTTIQAVMTEKPHTVAPQKEIYNAMVEMGDRKIKHLPVVQEGKLQGIVSFKDIIKIQPDLIDIVSFKSSMAQVLETK